MSLNARASSAHGLADLNTDIIGLIFSHLQDFKTLRSAILISKQFSRVFDKHPKSIVRRIARNVYGPLLDDLLALVRFEKPGFEWDDQDIPDDNERGNSLLDAFVAYHEELPDWQAACEDGQEVKASEIRAIRKCVQKCSVLEKWFSFRHKARIANKSSLTPLESHKFRRALYRLMLFQKCFAYREVIEDIRDTYEPYAELPYLANRPEALQRLFTARKNFLLTFESEELHEIQIIARFIVEMQHRLQFPSSTTITFHIRECPLQWDLELFIEGVRTGFFSVDFEGPEDVNARYLTGPLEEALKVQGSKLLDPSRDDFWINLLDSVEGQFDACIRCSVTRPAQLWNCTNWSVFFLHTQHKGPYWCTELALGLSSHAADGESLSNALAGSPPEVLLTQFHATYSETNDDWKKEDWLCTDCLIKFLQIATPKWWVNRKNERGDPVPSEDCCYGWNCRAMSRDSDHASNLNHFCKPTRELER
ncbi:hypothetical protein DL96DRAFT_1683439 [Flagelloscypha sp. PMI_526]|nr:hypothetical protein DL96DRAFT_1683439 [Flagelloscypha sp. PMI_526]